MRRGLTAEALARLDQDHRVTSSRGRLRGRETGQPAPDDQHRPLDGLGDRVGRGDLGEAGMPHPEQVLSQHLRILGSVMEGPPASPIRLVEKGRVALFWLGVRQYRLAGMPELDLVNVSCPGCNGFAPCPHAGVLDACNRVPASEGLVTGQEDVATRARLSSLSLPLRDGEEERVLKGFWALQTQRGLYGAFTVLIAVASGWLAGTLFGRGGH